MYDYELFSIMIHSGGAMGGHYFAYVKDLESKARPLVGACGLVGGKRGSGAVCCFPVRQFTRLFFLSLISRNALCRHGSRTTTTL